MYNFCKLFIFTLTSDFLFINSKSVSNAPKKCVVSFFIPQESIKTGCDGTYSYYINQKLRSTESQQMSLKRQVSDINIKLAYIARRYSKCRCETGIYEKLKSNGIPKILGATVTKSEQFDDELSSRLITQFKRQGINIDRNKVTVFMKLFSRNIRTIVRKELATFKQDLALSSLHNYELQRTNLSEMREQGIERQINITDVVKHDIDPRKTSVDYSKEYLQADSTLSKSNHGISDIRKLDKRSQNGYDNYDIIKNREYMTNKFEQIEHDIDTLSNGISALHDNMFESKDIKRQFSQEKIRMENSILEKLRNEYNLLDSKVEHTSNQLQVISNLLQATVKSQRDLQARIQNFNATFKLKTHKIDMDISEIIARLNTLNKSLDQSYYDNFSASDAKQAIATEDTITFVSKIKTIWPTLIKNVTAIVNIEDDLMNRINRTFERHELNIENQRLDFDARHSLRQQKNTASFRYFGLYHIVLILLVEFLFDQ